MGGARGLEWDFVEELVRGRHTSHVRCKSYGHEFHGSATHIKEHLFGNGGSIMACSHSHQIYQPNYINMLQNLRQKLLPLLQNQHVKARFQYLMSKWNM